MMIRFGFVLLLAVLSGCAGISTVIIGEVTQEVDAGQLDVFYSSQPSCDYDVVAWIQLPGEYFSQESLIRAMRFKSANLGATAVQVIFVQKSGSSTYRGTARALRCIT